MKRMIRYNALCFHRATVNQFRTSCMVARTLVCCETFLPILETGKMIREKMQGLTWMTLKKNYPLIPLFLCVGCGVAGGTLYLLRLAFRSPDVTWSVKKNPEPWNEYKNKRYKFMSPYGETDTKSQAPEY